MKNFPMDKGGGDIKSILEELFFGGGADSSHEMAILLALSTCEARDIGAPLTGMN